MKPIHLNMQAFGPFAGRESIDFSAMGEAPLFLINGPTGAGKSSILDAICFALYGRTTGAEREPGHMRCDHAEADCLTEVELTFSLGSQRYRVRRVPTQEKPKSRGEGTTEHKTEAQLWRLLPSGDEELRVPKSAAEVTSEIETLTGLTVEQFRQVMVLPQGKFRELLLADSRDREAIFSKLFQTHIFRRIEERLKSAAAGIRAQVEDQRNQVKGMLASADVDSETALEESIASLKPEYEDIRKAHEQAQSVVMNASEALTKGQALKGRFVELRKLTANLTEQTERQAEMEHLRLQLQRARAADQLTPAFKEQQRLAAESARLLKTQQTLAQQQAEASQLQAQAEQNLQKVQTEALQIDELKANRQRLEQQQQQLVQWQSATQELQQQQNARDESRSRLEQWQVQLRKDKQQLADGEHVLIGLHKELEALPALLLFEQKLKRVLDDHKKLSELLTQQSARQAERERHRERYVIDRSAVVQAERHVKELELRWHSNQAALLARELNEGKPCSVCGSLSHPSPAQLAGDQQWVDQQQIDAARQQLTAAQARLNETGELGSACKARLDALNEQIEKLKAEMGDAQAYTTTDLQQQVRALNEKRATLEKQKQQADTLDSQNAGLKVRIAEQEKQEASLREQQQQVAERFVLLQQQVQTLAEQLPEALRAPGALVNQLNQTITHIESLRNALERAQREFTQYQQSLTVLQTQYESVSQQLTNAQSQLKSASEQWQTALADSVFGDEEQYQSACLASAEQERRQVVIEKFENDYRQLVGAQKQLHDTLAAQQEPDIDLLQNALNEARDRGNDVDQRYQTIRQRVAQLENTRQKLQVAGKVRQELEDRYSVIGTLSDVANGQTGNKISLQRFVLSVLLDDVLIDASQRLLHMSRGRYQLVRKEDRSKGNKASGLELEVEDAYTGKTRSVATLSGGESFMAALALALGLSDVVQAYAGGIRLDTLFIDEGFGSLDVESLDLAIQTLVDLQASGRMIGIISHVSELKEQMALRIDVLPDRTGSRVSLNARSVT